MLQRPRNHNPTLSSPSDGRAAPAKLKVCHLVATTAGGTWMFEQLRELRDQYGFEVTAIVSGPSGPLIDQLDAEGIPHFAADFKWTLPRWLPRMALSIFKLARLFRRHRFDVVQTHVFITMVFGRLAAWLADVPVRLSMIAGPYHLKAHTPRWIERDTCWMETALIPSCEESLSLCREMGVGDERLFLIYYSADERKFDPLTTPPIGIRQRFGWQQDTPVVGMVAHFYHRLSDARWVPAHVQGRGVKGHGDLIKAAPAILAEFPEAKILLVGSGWGKEGEAYMQEVKELVQRMGLTESVVFAGYQADVNSILSEVDVAVQASLDENLGGTLEALLMECPLVATRVGGMVDTVRDGETGLLVSPSRPRELAARIIELLRAPERARALGRAGRRLVLERFTLDRTVKDLAELYQRLASGAEKKRKFYNPFVSLWRLIVFIPISAYLAFRLLFLDTYLPIFYHRSRSLAYRMLAPLYHAYKRMRARGTAANQSSRQILR